MSREIRKLMCVIVAIGVMIGCSATALAWINQQHYTNNTGQTAYDLTKIIEGIHDINTAYHVDFPYHTVEHVNDANRTIIHWYGGQVPNGSQAGACFNSESGEVLNALSAFWTDANGAIIGQAGPVSGTNAYQFMDNLFVEVTNTWRRYNGDGYPVDPCLIGDPMGYVVGTNVRWAEVDEPLTMEELTPALDGDPEITWHNLANFDLEPAETEVYAFGPIAEEKVAILRFDAEGEGYNTTEFLQWQIKFFNPPVAPSNLQATVMSGSRVDLSWQDNSNNESGFRIRRSQTNGGPYTTIGTVSANVTCYSDTKCSPGTTYYYVVCAYNAHGSACSNQATATPTGQAARGRWFVRDKQLIPQNSTLLREVIPAEDMDATHTVTWYPGPHSVSGGVRFFPSWNWGTPRPGDQLCWLYDSASLPIWWQSTFVRPSRILYIQLNGCDNNDGWVDIYVDGILEFSYDSYHRNSSPVLIIGCGFPNTAHTVKLQTRTGGCPHVGDVSIDYIAIPRRGWDVQEHFTNNTGQPAYDLTKILPGSWVITRAIHDRFKQHVVINFGLFTIIHWYDGVVLPGQQTAVCFDVLGLNNPPVACAFWTDGNGRIIGPAGVGLHINGRLVADELMVDVGHTWREWTGGEYPPQEGDDIGQPRGQITGDVYYTIEDERYELEEMDPNFVNDMVWTELDTDIVLNGGEIETYNLGQLDPCDVVIIRVEAEGEGQNSREMAQIRVEDLLQIPEAGDLNEDGCVNFKDVAVLADSWLVGCEP